MSFSVNLYDHHQYTAIQFMPVAEQGVLNAAIQSNPQNEISDQARRELVIAFLPRAVRVAKATEAHYHDREDLIQDLALELLGATMKNYDPDRTSCYRNFVISVLNRRANKHQRRRARRQEFDRQVVRDDDSNDIVSNIPDYRTTEESDLDVRVTIQAALNELKAINERWYQVIVDYFGLGEKPAETCLQIGDREGRTKWAVNQMLLRALEELEFIYARSRYRSSGGMP